MNNDRSDGHCYSFDWSWRSWTFSDSYFSFDRSSSLPIYGRRKNEENLSARSFTFLQNAVSNSVLFGFSFTFAAVSNASWLLKG